MLKKRLWTPRIGPAFAATVLFFYLSAVHAVPFDTDIAISGSTTFDSSTSFGGSGDFNLISGGVTTTSTFVDSSVTTGVNPLPGTLTDNNDGLGFSGSASVTDDEFLIGFDTSLNVTNNSTDIFWITINLAFDNLVNADGADAYAHSELVLKENGTEIFFSDLKSDTFFGDENGAVLTGGFGDVLTESGNFVKVFELNPADVLMLDLSWTLEGGDYATGLAEGDLSAFLSVTSAEKRLAAVPAPPTLSLLGVGIILLSVRRRFKHS